MNTTEDLQQTTSHTQIKDHAAAAVLKDLGSCIEISIPGFATDPALQAQAPPKIMTRAKTATRATTPTVIRAIPQYRTQGQEGRVRKKCIIYTICTYPILSHTVAQKSQLQRETPQSQRERERESRDFHKFSNFIYISHNKKTKCLIRRRRVRRRKDSDSALRKRKK